MRTIVRREKNHSVFESILCSWSNGLFFPLDFIVKRTAAELKNTWVYLLVLSAVHVNLLFFFLRLISTVMYATEKFFTFLSSVSIDHQLCCACGTKIEREICTFSCTLSLKDNRTRTFSFYAKNKNVRYQNMWTYDYCPCEGSMVKKNAPFSRDLASKTASNWFENIHTFNWAITNIIQCEICHWRWRQTWFRCDSSCFGNLQRKCVITHWLDRSVLLYSAISSLLFWFVIYYFR